MIRVWNNGDGIPVEMHKEEGVYVPELIFGHLLTSSNYNDQEKKVSRHRLQHACMHHPVLLSQISQQLVNAVFAASSEHLP